MYDIIKREMPEENFFAAFINWTKKTVSFPYYKDSKSPNEADRDFGDDNIGGGVTEFTIKANEPTYLPHYIFWLLEKIGAINLMGDYSSYQIAVPVKTHYSEVAVVLSAQSYESKNRLGIKHLMILTLIAEGTGRALDHFRSMEDRLRQLAHELKNPLNVISLDIQDATTDSEEGCLTLNRMKEVEEQTKRCLCLISEIIDNSRELSGHLAVKPIILNQVVRQTIFMFSRPLGIEGIKIEVTLAKEDVKIAIIETHFKQALANIIHNARDAMLEKREKGEKVPLEILISSRVKGDMAEVIIIDSGGGIPDKVIGRIFNPYFTTKKKGGKGGGEGIGLVLSQKLIKRAGGEITVKNVVTKYGPGAEFTIALPTTTIKPSIEI
jgi:signal transduction histidine kinase